MVEKNLEKEFINVCRKYGGENDSSLGYVYCYFQPNFPMEQMTLRFGTTSPTLRVTAGHSHVELTDVEDISHRPNSILFVNKHGNIVNVRPSIGIATFNGDVKGSIWCCDLEGVRKSI